MNSKKKRLDSITFWGVVLIIVAIILICAMEFFKLPHVLEWYKQYEYVFEGLQEKITNIDNKFGILVIILFLFFMKSVIPFPLYPISFVCVLTSVVFNTYLSLLINLFGLVILFYTKYLWGKKLSSGIIGHLLPKNQRLWNLISKDDNGNPWLLVVFRLIPTFPINSISSIYGSLEFNRVKYLLLSIAGFLPKLISYTIIGRNAFEPMSQAFILPIVILLLFTGISMIGINELADLINGKINGNEDANNENENI